jgi:polyribonucleotide nucleotidyltransferase
MQSVGVHAVACILLFAQVWVQVLSADGSIDPEVVAINAASAALLLAPSIPFTHPVGYVPLNVGLHAF